MTWSSRFLIRGQAKAQRRGRGLINYKGARGRRYRDLMDRADAVPAAAVLQAPSWLWGNNPSAFFSEARLQGRLVDAENQLWRVQTEENYLHARPSLITVCHVAGPEVMRPRFETLQRLADRETPVPTANDPVIAKEIDRLGKRAVATGNPVDAFAWAQLLSVAAPPSDLPAAVRFIYEGLLQVGLTEDEAEKVFANCGVHVFQRDPALIHRLKMASVWLRLSADENLRVGDLHEVKTRLAAGDGAFASSEGLYDGIYTLDAYIGPLLGALSPAIWSFHASRILGTIVYTLGQPIAGTTGTASELLHVLPHQGAYEASKIPSLRPSASVSAVDWWADRLNRLFAILSDPGVFTDQEKRYVPEKHLHALLTVEQLFRRVASIQTSHRDANARRTLFFTILDTLERLTGRDLTVLCSLRFAQKTFDALDGNVPDAAAEILLPAARRAVDALESLQQGFFISRHAGSSRIEWTDPSTGHVQHTLDEAAAEYIKVLRNSTHGHGSNRANQVVRTNALLTHHNGHVPHNLALLGYLYLLDLLNRPDDLRLSLYQRGKA
jgi:hypothetical protein